MTNRAVIFGTYVIISREEFSNLTRRPNYSNAIGQFSLRPRSNQFLAWWTSRLKPATHDVSFPARSLAF